MADFAVNASVETVADYELYCHYVAGLVGEGVTRMFVLASLAEPRIREKPELAESMAQLLQQTNIVRDVHEDHLGNRHFWPTEVWSKHVEKFGDLFRKDPHSQRKALECLSEMVLMALEKAPDCLSYMANVREQSVFNFVAIPQTMAMATLELCFQNPLVFDRNIKITRGVACQLLIDSTKDLRYVAEAFSKHAAKIQKKKRSEDPDYSKIDAACTAITQSTHRLLLDYKSPWMDQTIAVKSNGPRTVLVLVTSFALLGTVIAALFVRKACHICMNTTDKDSRIVPVRRNSLLMNFSQALMRAILYSHATAFVEGSSTKFLHMTAAPNTPPITAMYAIPNPATKLGVYRYPVMFHTCSKVADPSVARTVTCVRYIEKLYWPRDWAMGISKGRRAKETSRSE